MERIDEYTTSNLTCNMCFSRKAEHCLLFSTEALQQDIFEGQTLLTTAQSP